MFRLCLLAFPILSFLLPVAHADDWTKTFPVTATPELRIETGDGNITIEPWNKQAIEVRISTVNWKIGDHGLQIIEHQEGNQVELRVPTSGAVNFRIGHSIRRRLEIQVSMPAQAKLNLTTSDGSISFRGMTGEFSVRTGDGRQEIENVDGKLEAHSGDGRIEVSGRFDRLQLTSGDGRISAKVLAGSKIESDWSMRAGDGSIELRVPESFRAEVEMRTGDGHLELDLPVEVNGPMNGKSLRGKLNGGGERLTLRTGNGSIRLGKT